MNFVHYELVTLSGLPALSGTLANLKNDDRAATAAARAWLALIDSEFASGYWLSPGGPKVPWLRTKAFGSQPAPARTLERSGALRASYQRARVSVRGRQGGTEITIQPIRLPYSAVHRGGVGQISVLEARQPHRLAVTPKMRGFLRGQFGVNLRKDTTELVTPRRPHATVSPMLRTTVIAIFAANIAGRPIPERFAA